MAKELVDTYKRIMVALDWISQGYTKTRACDECGLSTTAFDRYINTDDRLVELVSEAERRGYDSLADALVEINTSRHGSNDPKMASVLSKNIQWFLSRRRPKEYGDRVTVEHTITADKVITDALTRGKARAIAGPILENVTYAIVDGLSSEEHAELMKLF